MKDQEALERILDGRSWDEFCESLKSARAALFRADSPQGAFDRAEGYRHLSRLLRLALERFVEHADPEHPRFYQMARADAKLGADNPDCRYQNCALDGTREYRIRGRRGTSTYLGIGTYYGHYGDASPSGCSGYMDSADLAVDADGRFEILLAQTPRPGNWLPMEPRTSSLIVREFFLDRSNEVPVELEIDCLGVEGPPRPLDPAELDRALATASAFVKGSVDLFTGWAESFAKRPNELHAPPDSVRAPAHKATNQIFYHGYWELAPDEALVITATPPVCRYWNFQLNNYWLESLDYRYHPISVNKHSVRLEPDGSFRIIVCARDPGFGNWMDTAGHDRGTMGLRWNLAYDPPEPACRVMRFDDLVSAERQNAIRQANRMRAHVTTPRDTDRREALHETGDEPRGGAFDAASILADARRATGLEDFGDESFREPLARLLASLAQEARLTPAGAAAQRARLVALLAVRLRTQDWLARHPEIEDEPVDVRFVIVGFPRTGTTLLQRVLARDPRSGWLAWWECRHPAPLPGWSADTARQLPDARIARAQAEVAAMLAANPALAAQHPLDALAPDEDLLLLEHAFQSSTPCGSQNVPSYMRWHLAQDGIATYRDHARFLRFLGWQKRMRGEPAGPYVLKAPHHMLHLDRLLEHFPSATIVQTHRDPLETLPSLASLSLELRRLGCETAQPSECAEYALATARARLAAIERVRMQTPAQKWVDVWFGDVAADPLAVVEQIYARAGLALPQDVRSQMADWVRENGRDRRPAHGYALERFGLDAEAIVREFADYRERFVIPNQRRSEPAQNWK